MIACIFLETVCELSLDSRDSQPEFSLSVEGKEAFRAFPEPILLRM